MKQTADNYQFLPKEVRFLYDALGRRVARLYSGQNAGKKFEDEVAIYDGLRVLEEYGYDDGKLRRRYYYEPNAKGRIRARSSMRTACL